MAKNTFIEKEPDTYVRLWNDTGAALVAGEFCLIGGIAAIAQEAIAIGAYGGFVVGEGLVFQTATLKTGEKTFATPNQDVFWDNTGKTFSDTSTAGYYKIGQLAEVIDSGVIRVIKQYKAEVVAAATSVTLSQISDLEDLALADLADVNTAGVTNNDTLKYDTATSKWIVVAQAD